ncbi:MAG: NADH-quinone oxidoreductase subunit B family protein [Candidatus Diapherotrites archaeon]|nr:NADH-quinone oxidoreductase subunit B family protein [Candidatus Diapherotrites archaeon]
MALMKKSPWVAVYNASSCNGCDLEVLAMLTPRYDIERFGCLWRDSPRHADILLVTGIGTKQSAKRLKRIYDQMASPKYVIAVGSCAISGGVFKEGHNFAGPIDKIIPVDAYVPGCPPRPESIILGVVKVLEKMK